MYVVVDVGDDPCKPPVRSCGVDNTCDAPDGISTTRSMLSVHVTIVPLAVRTHIMYIILHK